MGHVRFPLITSRPEEGVGWLAGTVLFMDMKHCEIRGLDSLF